MREFLYSRQIEILDLYYLLIQMTQVLKGLKVVGINSVDSKRNIPSVMGIPITARVILLGRLAESHVSF